MKRKTQINLVRIAFLVLFLGVIASGKMVLWLLLFAITLPLAIFFGRIYCGYVCPMHTVMIAADGLVTHGNKPKNRRSAPKWLQHAAIPWLLLAVSVAALLGSRRLLQINLPLLPFFVILAFVVTLFYKPEVFHNFICPFGAMQKLFGRWSKRSHTVTPAACIGCHKCEKVCPALAVVVSAETKKATIDRAACLQCQNCSLVCPTRAIAWQKKP
jgi:polyferredoxin